MKWIARVVARSAAGVVTCALAAAGVDAQPVSTSVGAGAARLVLVSADESARLMEAGVIGSATLRVRFGRLELGAGYAEGAVGAPDQRRLFAEASADASVALAPWLLVRAGPVSRLIRNGDAIERWLQWRGALVTRTPIARTPFAAHSALWGASGAVLGTRATGRGGSAGVAWRRAGTTVLLEYGIDELSATIGARRTVESLRLQVEVGASRR